MKVLGDLLVESCLSGGVSKIDMKVCLVMI